MSRQPRIVLSAVFALFLAASAASADVDNLDRDIAALYVDAANTALEEGNGDRSLELARIAVEYAPDSSDALHLIGLALLGQQQHTQAALAASRDALSADRWFRFSPTEGIITLASLLLQVREYGELLDLVAGATAGGGVASRDAFRPPPPEKHRVDRRHRLPAGSSSLLL